MRRRTQPSRVAAVTVTHIPFLAGYYAQSLDVLQLAFASLQAHTEEDCDVWVFDNASCEDVRSFLLGQQAGGWIDYLILSSENVGVLAAHNALFAAVPNEFVAYADSDVYFRPGWLPACLGILETFPNAGLVTGMPVRSAVGQAAHTALDWVAANAEVQHETGRLIPLEWIEAFCAGTGRALEPYLEESQHLADHRLTYRGVTAYVGASSFQLVARRATLQQTLPLPSDWLLHGAGDLLERIDAAGQALLATDGLFVHHLGNTLTPAWRAEAKKLGLAPASRQLAAAPGGWTRLARAPLIRRGMFRLYDSLFRLLYGDKA
jgi:hypothetical protein